MASHDSESTNGGSLVASQNIDNGHPTIEPASSIQAITTLALRARWLTEGPMEVGAGT